MKLKKSFFFLLTGALVVFALTSCGLFSPVEQQPAESNSESTIEASVNDTDLLTIDCRLLSAPSAPMTASETVYDTYELTATVLPEDLPEQFKAVTWRVYELKDGEELDASDVVRVKSFGSRTARIDILGAFLGRRIFVEAKTIAGDLTASCEFSYMGNADDLYLFAPDGSLYDGKRIEIGLGETLSFDFRPYNKYGVVNPNGSWKSDPRYMVAGMDAEAEGTFLCSLLDASGNILEENVLLSDNAFNAFDIGALFDSSIKDYDDGLGGACGELTYQNSVFGLTAPASDGNYYVVTGIGGFRVELFFFNDDGFGETAYVYINEHAALPENHVCSFGGWVVTEPTTEAEGSAVRSCTEPACMKRATITLEKLPALDTVLTDADFSDVTAGSSFKVTAPVAGIYKAAYGSASDSTYVELKSSANPEHVAKCRITNTAEYFNYVYLSGREDILTYTEGYQPISLTLVASEAESLLGYTVKKEQNKDSVDMPFQNRDFTGGMYSLGIFANGNNADAIALTVKLKGDSGEVITLNYDLLNVIKNSGAKIGGSTETTAYMALDEGMNFVYIPAGEYIIDVSYTVTGDSTTKYVNTGSLFFHKLSESELILDQELEGLSLNKSTFYVALETWRGF